MGEPGWGNARSSVTEFIGHGTRTGGTETSQYLEGTTDSAPVPWGKGEKNPGEGSEIEPETVHLQAIGALYPARGMCDGVPFA